MSRMHVPTNFRSLPASALRVGRPLTAEMASILAGNTGWLYEATCARPVPGQEQSRVSAAFNHTGAGSGAPVATVQTLLRGWFGCGSDFMQPVLIDGEGRDEHVLMAHPDFHHGNVVDGVTIGYTWRRSPTSPVPLHPYGRYLRTRIQARRLGDAPAHLTPVLFADEAGRSPLHVGSACHVDSASFVTLDLLLDSGIGAGEEGGEAARIGHWGLVAWVGPDCLLEIRDSDETGACLALSSFEV